MNKILFAASECVPFVKTGGLADVVGALPKEFDKAYWDIRVVLPDYTCIPPEFRDKVHCMHYDGEYFEMYRQAGFRTIEQLVDPSIDGLE